MTGRRDCTETPKSPVAAFAEVGHEPGRQRLVEAELVADGRELLGRGLLACDDLGRVAGHEAGQQQDRQRQDGEDRHRRQQPLPDRAQHGSGPWATWNARRALDSRTGRCRRPRTTRSVRSSGGRSGSSRNVGARSARAANATSASSRVSGAPTQKWMPPPKAMCTFGVRETSIRSGVGNGAGSGFAAASMGWIVSPCCMAWPPSSRSVQIDRRPGRAPGLTQRSISTAPGALSARSAQPRPLVTLARTGPTGRGRSG